MGGVVPQGGLSGGSPPGGCRGGVVPRKKSSRKNIEHKNCPNRVINSICAWFKKFDFFKIEKKMKKNRPTGGVVPQGGMQGGVVPFFSEGAHCAADLMCRGRPDRLAALSKAPRRGSVGIYFLTRLEPFLTSLFLLFSKYFYPT